MPISDAVTELLPSPVLKKYYPKFEEYKQDLDTRLKIVNSPDLTVSKYIKILYDFIKSYPEYEDQCVQRTERNARYVRYVINAFGILLTYNEHDAVLTKQVAHRKHIPPFITPSTMTAFSFEPEDIFNCGQCGRVLRGDDLPPWKAPPMGVKYYTTRGEGEHEELICHKCAAEEAARSPKAMSPKAMSPKAASRSPKAAARSPKAAARSPKAAAKSPKTASRSPKAAAKSPKAAARSPKAAARSPKASSASGGGTRKSRTTRCRTQRRAFRK